MIRTWQIESGHLSCYWSETPQNVTYRPRWMEEASNVPSGHLPPVPDFASHSPFCGAFWFQAFKLMLLAEIWYEGGVREVWAASGQQSIESRSR